MNTLLRKIEQLHFQFDFFDREHAQKIKPVRQEQVKPVEPVEPVVEWDESAIYELRYGMLLTAISEIRDQRKSKAMREEARDWLFAENDNSPFSAEICAKQTGYDIDELRRLLKRLMPSL